MITEFTPYLSLIGGILIGLSAVILMWLNGRIAGMTGILAGVLPPYERDWPSANLWRAIFLIGAITAPMIWLGLGNKIDFAVPVSNIFLAVGGLLVGIGVTFGGGCTSGHGVCGIARLSPRSIVATVVFMLTTFATVYVLRHLV